MLNLKKFQWIIIFFLPLFSQIHAQDESIYGMISFVSGEAFVVRPNSSPEPARLSMIIKPEDTIKTNKGNIRVQVADIFICHIEKNTTVTFREILNNKDSETMNVYMGKGQIFARLIPGRTKKAKLSVTTPTVTAGVRGTDFMVSEAAATSENESSTPSGVYVSNGKVDVESTDGKFKVSVNGGEQATVSAGELRKAILDDFISTKMKILDELKIMKEYNCRLVDEQKEKNRKLLEELK